MKDHSLEIPLPSDPQSSGFTFVEMLVAVALSTVCLGAGALALQSFSANAKRTTSLIELDIGEATNLNFYENDESTILTFQAPNFGRLLFTQEMREKLAEDAARSSAVFCLPRGENTNNIAVRPLTLNYPGGVVERPNLDTPEAFRTFLSIVEPTSAGVFSSPIRNVPDLDKNSTSIFLLGPADESDIIQVNAIYEIDFLTPSNVTGVYASVRRYVGEALTHYYDVFYPFPQGRSPGDDFHPQFVVFEHESRQLANESTNIRRFQLAPTSPFYLIWLPDPSINPYTKQRVVRTDPPTLARSTYEQMAEKSSFTLVLPMFPSF